MTRAALAALLLAGAASAQVPDASLLHAVTLESSLRGPVDWRAVQVVVTPVDPKAPPPTFVTRRGVALDAHGAYVVGELDRLAAGDRPGEALLRASWVIDFDQPAFAPVWAAVERELGPHPTPAQLTAFASRYLEKKSYDRAFDLASQVAKRRGGDCTEHAVFLAALLRHAHVPARAMVGLVLIATDQAPAAFGHMWVEAWVDGAWRVLDAALPPSLSRAYLPAGPLADEGPGYVLPLAAAVNTLRFSHLTLRARP